MKAHRARPCECGDAIALLLLMQQWMRCAGKNTAPTHCVGAVAFLFLAQLVTVMDGYFRRRRDETSPATPSSISEPGVGM